MHITLLSRNPVLLFTSNRSISLLYDHSLQVSGIEQQSEQTNQSKPSQGRQRQAATREMLQKLGQQAVPVLVARQLLLLQLFPAVQMIMAMQP
jgi:hypothetical protein